MDSPEPAQTTNITSTVAASAVTALSDSPPVQESPFTNFASNLSPIKPVKAAHPVQGFAVVSSPIVFTSPHTVPLRETSFLHRSQLSQISRAEISQNVDSNEKVVGHFNGLEKYVIYCSRSITDIPKDNDIENSPEDQHGSSSGCVDEFLHDPVDVECSNAQNFVNPSIKQCSDGLQSSVSNLSNYNEVLYKPDDKNEMSLVIHVSEALPEKVEEDQRGQYALEIEPVQVEEVQSSICELSNKCPNNESDLPSDHASEQYDDSKCQASQLQRGFSRRCLQFEEAQQITILNSTFSPDLASNITSLRSPASATDLENSDSYHGSVTESNHKKQMVNLSRPLTSMFPPNCSGKSSTITSRPSGIGLHLNSIVNALPTGHSTTANTKSTTIMSCNQVDYSNSSSNLNAPKDKMPEAKVNPQDLDDQVTPLNKRKFNSEHADNFEEFSQSSSTKKKREKSLSIDGDGCKRCNCKKSKCLKLYCDCFAAGIYCAEPCACQGCFNRPEYENMVLETRQQIESRNPLAFAPRVVQQVTEVTAASREDGNQSAASLARHKRGCNCKRSMCLKKYCECYQANVGCSSECRCEGCRNVYGKKDEYGMTEDFSNRVSEQRLEGRVHDKLAIVATNKDLLHPELHDMHSLTPSTPSFQHSDHGKDAARSRLNSSRYVPSPESDLSILPLNVKFMSSPRNSQSNDVITGSKAVQEADSCSQEMECNIAEMMNQFSPRCNTLADIYELTPSQTALASMTSSVSSKAIDLSSGSRLQLCAGSGRISSGRSLRWRCSPITPMARLGENKKLGHDTESGLYGILEDDTPEILKEASTPITSIKATSPNKKRISPPHNHLRDLRSNTSAAGLRSGRKFILKAVPSFPPLTPCIDPKNTTSEKK